jgi:hypothetical protein
VIAETARTLVSGVTMMQSVATVMAMAHVSVVMMSSAAVATRGMRSAMMRSTAT